MRGYALLAVCAGLGLIALSGCASRQPTVVAAPPIAQAPGAPVGAAPAGGVYDWRDVPVGERVPVMRAVFDQAGYQIYAASGETIVVPFVNQNLYVMRFGRSDNGQMFFQNDGSEPTLYLPMNGYLENAVAQGARWYPLPQDYAYTRPVYVGIAPSWNDYMGMGWYPGMMTYGGMWGYAPTASFVWMPSFYVSIGGRRYSDYVSYRTYYTSHSGYVRNRVVYQNYTPPRRTVTNFGRSSGSFGSTRSTGSFGTGRTSGSFGTGRTGGGFGTSSGSFGRSSGGSGSFGTGRTSGGFGTSSGSFGRSSSSSGSSSGGSSSSPGRSSGSSFGTSSGSRYNDTGRSTGSSFGRSSGSSGGSSFGRSSGGSFGRRR